MSSRKSDILLPLVAGGPRPWVVTLRSNILLPVLVVLMWPLGRLVEWSPYVNDYFSHVVLMVGISVTLAVSLQLINGVAGQFSLGHAGFMAVGAYMAGYATKTYAPDFAAAPQTADAAMVAAFFLALLVVMTTGGGLLAVIFVAVRRTRRVHRALPGVLAVVLAAWFVHDISAARGQAELPWYLLWPQILARLGDVFEWIMGMAAKAAPAVNSIVPACMKSGTTLLAALLGGGIMAAAAGLIVGLPTLRLRGDYLAIATLGFAEIIRVAVVNSEALGKATGLSVPPYSIEPNPEEGMAGQRIFPWIYGWMLITIVVVWRLANSAKGRALQAVREDETAAAATGIDATHHKVLAFVVGAFFAGIAGGLYAHLDGYLNPNSFGIMKSIELVVMVTLGGLGSISGAILAAAVLTWLPELLRAPADWAALLLRPFGVRGAEDLHMPQWLVDALAAVGENRMVFYALLLIVMMLLRPRGLLGGRELWPQRRTLHARPPAATEDMA